MVSWAFVDNLMLHVGIVVTMGCTMFSLAVLCTLLVMSICASLDEANSSSLKFKWSTLFWTVVGFIWIAVHAVILHKMAG